ATEGRRVRSPETVPRAGRAGPRSGMRAGSTWANPPIIWNCLRVSCVEALLVQEQVDAERVKLGEECDKVLETAPEPVHRPHHDRLGGVAAERIERGPLRPKVTATKR